MPFMPFVLSRLHARLRQLLREDLKQWVMSSPLLYDKLWQNRRMRRLRRRINLRMIIGMGIVLTALFLQFTPNQTVRAVMDRIEGVIYNLRFYMTLEAETKEGAQPPGHRIVIVDVDEKTLEAEGRWPWRRDKIGLLVDKLQQAGIGVIAFDIVFAEPQRNPMHAVLELLEPGQGAADELPGRLEEWIHRLDYDRLFAESIADAPVVLGMLLQGDETVQSGRLPLPTVEMPPEHLDRLLVFRLAGFTSALPSLQDAAASVGFINVKQDIDGPIRRSQLLLRVKDHLLGSLDVETLRVYFDKPVGLDLNLNEATGALEVKGLWFGDDHFVPTDQHGQILVPYRGGARSFPYISATDVLNDRVPRSELEGAIALVGTSALGLVDLRTTPLQASYPGVEVHANILAGMLHPEWLYRTPELADFILLGYLIALGLVLTVLMPRLTALQLIVGSLAAVFVSITVNVLLWTQLHWNQPLATDLMLVVMLALYNFSSSYLREYSQRQVIRGFFNQYVPPAHIDAMLSDPDTYHMEGERREITVMFSDIRSFTSISERLEADQLKNLLNRYFTPVTKAIFDNQGTVDKYVGDMVMAFWGAPIDDERHAENALATSLEMLRITDRLNEEFRQDRLPEIRIGVGLNTGQMNVGDMGSEYRRAYTVLGDAVNLGSRLEGLTKFYGVNILLSEHTAGQCPSYVFRPIDRVIVKGKTKSVQIYEPIGEAGALDGDELDELERYRAAYGVYLARRWDDAREAFEELRHRRERGVYRVYLARIADYAEEAPDGDWQGEFAHIAK